MNNKSLKIFGILIFLSIIALGGFFILTGDSDAPINNNGENNNGFQYGLYTGIIESYSNGEVIVNFTINQDGTATFHAELDGGWITFESTRGTFTVQDNEIIYTRLYMDLGNGEMPFDVSQFERPISTTETFIFDIHYDLFFMNITVDSITIYNYGFELAGVFLSRTT